MAAVRARRSLDDEGNQPLTVESEAAAVDKYDTDTSTLERRGRGSYTTAVRVLWWVSIGAVLIGVGLSDAYDASQTAIYAVGAVAMGAVVLLHDLLPERLRSAPVIGLEIALAIGLTTAILLLTGFASSPFVFGYNLVAVAVALALGGPIALVVATGASLAFLGVIAVDPAFGDYTTADLLRFGLQIGSIWLLAYVAGVFASGERRMRDTVLQMSRTDALTGLYNRGQLYPTLEQEVQRTRRSERGFCLLMIDLDGLKAINDSLGHRAGDLSPGPATRAAAPRRRQRRRNGLARTGGRGAVGDQTTAAATAGASGQAARIRAASRRTRSCGASTARTRRCAATAPRLAHRTLGQRSRLRRRIRGDLPVADVRAARTQRRAGHPHRVAARRRSAGLALRRGMGAAERSRLRPAARCPR